jgi:hypothetical protein
MRLLPLAGPATRDGYRENARQGYPGRLRRNALIPTIRIPTAHSN